LFAAGTIAPLAAPRAALAAATTAAELLTHGGPLFIAQLAVAVFVVLLQHPRLRRFTHGGALFLVQLAVAVLVELLDAIGPAGALARLVALSKHGRTGQQH